VEREELTDGEGELTVKVGDSIEIVVSGKDESSGTLMLGSQHARRMHGIEGLQQAYDDQTPVEGHVTGTIKGGLEVAMSSVRAFCPASQIDINYVEDLETFVGERLAFRITKIEGGRHPDLVVSRRALLEEEQQALATETRAHLEVGAVMQGRVSSLKEFGAFIDLGGVEGMVHISELAFGRVEHPQDILSVGQEVEVSVLKIEKTDNPRHPERFIELASGVDGLVHISELGAGRRVSHPQEVVSVGDRVQARVLSVDLEKHRIGLSLDKKYEAEESARPEVNVADYTKPEQSFGTLGDLLKESLKKQE